MFIPHSSGSYTKDVSGGKLMEELGLNLGDLVPFQLDDEGLGVGEEFCDAEIHGPRESWEGLLDD